MQQTIFKMFYDRDLSDHKKKNNENAHIVTLNEKYKKIVSVEKQIVMS